MKVAFIHNEKKFGTGANYINDLMSLKLKTFGLEVKNFYPKMSLIDTPTHMVGIKNILFFFSLIEKRREILKFDLIQGTTYTALPFLAYPIPVVSHFGSTTRGFLKSTPLAKNMEKECQKIWFKLKHDKVIKELNIKTRKPVRDIADIEEYVASNADAIIAVSENVRNELVTIGVEKNKIFLIHNAIEDYWFNNDNPGITDDPNIVFLGRLGNDAFTLKLKGFDRLIHLYNKFEKIKKTTICMTTNKSVASFLKNEIPNHTLHQNIIKDKIPGLLAPLCGSILFISSRYEGFSLSLIEGMSQGLIPITYAVGVAPEIIINEQNGFIVSNQDEAVEKIKLILSDKSLREKLSKEAVKTSKQFSSSNISQELIKVYESVIKLN